MGRSFEIHSGSQELSPRLRFTGKQGACATHLSGMVAAFVPMTHSITSFPVSLTAMEMLAWCTSMPIYFRLSIGVILSVGLETDASSLVERGAPL
jgi:hypothetical protein